MSLNDKIVKLDMCDCDKECYWPEDVKEAVKELKDVINRNAFGNLIIFNNKIIDSIFGEKLI